MIKPGTTVLATLCLFAWVLLGSTLVQSQTWDESVTRAVRYDKWPKTEGEVRGFRFVKDDYAALGNFAIASDAETAHQRSPGVHPDRVWFDGREPYRFLIERQVKLESPVGERLHLKVTVAPSVVDAHRWLLEPWNSVTSFTGDSFVLGAEHDLAIADVCILRDPPANRKEWDPKSTKSLFFIRNNVVIDIVATGSDVDVIGLARAMDGQIELQRIAANGSPSRPEVKLELGSKTVRVKDFSPFLASVEVKYAATWENDEKLAKVFAFSAREVDNFKTNDDGEVVPDEEQPKTFAVGNLQFDDTSKPSKIDQIAPGKDGKHHVGIVAWGPNLLPRVLYVEFDVIGRDR